MLHFAGSVRMEFLDHHEQRDADYLALVQFRPRSRGRYFQPGRGFKSPRQLHLKIGTLESIPLSPVSLSGLPDARTPLSWATPAFVRASPFRGRLPLGLRARFTFQPIGGSFAPAFPSRSLHGSGPLRPRVGGGPGNRCQPRRTRAVRARASGWTAAIHRNVQFKDGDRGLAARHRRGWREPRGGRPDRRLGALSEERNLPLVRGPFHRGTT